MKIECVCVGWRMRKGYEENYIEKDVHIKKETCLHKIVVV